MLKMPTYHEVVGGYLATRFSCGEAGELGLGDAKYGPHKVSFAVSSWAVHKVFKRRRPSHLGCRDGMGVGS